MIKNNSLFKIIIAIILVLIIIISVILFILTRKQNNVNPNHIGQEKGEYKLNNELQEFNDTNMYFVVKNIIQKLNYSCVNMNVTAKDIFVRTSAYKGEELEKHKEEEAKKMNDEAVEKVYNMLSDDYIKEFNINKQNIKEKFKVENKYESIIERIYRFQNSTNVWTYLIKGINVDLTNEKSESYNIGVTVDIYNKTFCIYPQEYIEKYKYDKLELGDEIDEDIEKIEGNTDNIYKYEMVDEEEICKEYFNKTKKILLFDVDFSYEMLDKEYKEKKFENIEQYRDWVQKNYNNIRSSVTSKYKTTTEKGVTEYICQDTNDNYYVFKKSNTVDFTMYLDTYTITLNEFTENYNKADEKEKAKMNIQNVFQAINRKDYNYVYNHLDETFRKNNFDNMQKLENYLESNLYDVNDIDGEKYSNEGDVQIFSISVTRKNKDSMKKYMNINMKLKEKDDFVMSFSIK